MGKEFVTDPLFLYLYNPIFHNKVKTYHSYENIKYYKKARKSNSSLLHSDVRVYLNCIRSFRFLYFILLLIKKNGYKKEKENRKWEN